MSRIGKLPVAIPAGVKVTVANNLITVEGPKGKLTQDFCDLVSGKKECPTTLKESLECHLMGIAAEKSRKDSGKLVKVHRD